MQRSEFLIKKMDCPSEENMIRMKLDGYKEIKSMDFDILNRRLTIYHTGDIKNIEKSIEDLNFGSSLVRSEKAESELLLEAAHDQRSLLWKVLLINFSFFVIEITTGFLSKSMGLVADSLDMLADALVYAMSLLAVGGTITRKRNVAKISGYFQLLLAVIGFAEVIRRFLGFEKLPDFKAMIVVSILALTANVICLYLLQRSKSQEAHMKASMIFTSNDIIINLGVIVAGALVYLLDSNKPDLVIGSIVFIIVSRGAFRILQLAK